jgi:hypothetical protein
MVRTLKVEGFDHFVVCVEKHVQYLASAFLDHDREERPHQSRGNVPLSMADRGSAIAHILPDGPVVCSERLGWFLKHFDHVAA